MAISLNDSINPADNNEKLSLIQTLNTFAFILKKITGQSSWKVPPPLALTELDPMSVNIKFPKCVNNKLALTSNNSVQVLDANPNRIYAVFINSGNSDITLVLGDKDTAILESGIIVKPNGGSFEINQFNLYTGIVSAVSQFDSQLSFIEGFE